MASTSAEPTARFSGRRALVTGAASGIGRACVRRLVAEGARVVGLDIDADGALAAHDDLPPGSVHVEQVDVRSTASVESAIAAATAWLGEPADICISAAGIYRIRPLVELTDDDWDEMLDVNLRGTARVVTAFARTLGDGSGSAVLIGSTAALIADAGEPTGPYNASKAGILALTRQMAAEWAPWIRVNAVCPGVIDTPMLRLMDDPETADDFLSTFVPLRRLGQPEEVAAAITFLASDDASYITGAALPVDGGTLAI